MDAKHETRCPKCKLLILPGVQIRRWFNKWTHVACLPKNKADLVKANVRSAREKRASDFWEELYAKAGRRN